MLGYYKMSLIGTAHQAKKDGVCQDASDVIELENGWVVAAIADGLGSAKRSEIGAATAVKTVLSFVRENHPEKWHEESLISLLRTAYHKAFTVIKTKSVENQDDLREYDTTLTTVIYNGTNVVYGHVGDGGIIVLSSFGEYSVLTEAQKGETFNETSPLRAGPDNWSFGVSKEDVCALIMVTDGIFDVAYPWLLAKSNQPIYVNYVRPFMDINLLKVSTPADFENAQTEIAEFFNGPYSKQITDDKTIVGIINTSVVPETKPDDYYMEPDWQALAKAHHDRLYCSEESTSSKLESEVSELSQVTLALENEKSCDSAPLDQSEMFQATISPAPSASKEKVKNKRTNSDTSCKEANGKKRGVWKKLIGKSK